MRRIPVTTQALSPSPSSPSHTHSSHIQYAARATHNTSTTTAKSTPTTDRTELVHRRIDAARHCAQPPLRNRATPTRSPCRESCSCIHVLRSPSPCSSDTQTHFDAHITQAHMHATHHEWCCCSHDPCAAHSGSPHPLQHAAHWVVHPRSATPVGMHRRIKIGRASCRERV